MTPQPAIIPPVFVDWLGDVVAVERHFEDALDDQARKTSAPPIIMHLQDAVHDSRVRAEAFRDHYALSETLSVLQQGLDLFGKAVGLNEQIKTESVDKALRNDFVACNLAAVNYSMLHTTAIALENEGVAAFAAQGLRTYATLIAEINAELPGAVVRELVGADSATPIDANAAAIASSQQQGLWFR